MKKIFLFGISVLFILSSGWTQNEKSFNVACIAFYNVENLFDTINSPGINDVEYTPEAAKQWNTERYFNKIDRLAEVISKIGVELTGSSPAIVGLCEVENAEVLKDLVADYQISDYNYQIVHIPGPDRRGVDCALIYRPEFFTVQRAVSYRLKTEIPDFITRDQLVVTGLFQGEEMTFIVLHYPSRRGGEKASRPRRAEAADLTRHIVDSILNQNADAKIIVMGDLNDDPTDPSVLKHLNSTGKKANVKEKVLFNPMFDLHKQGIGSLAYRDQWNLFDQILLSASFLHESKDSYRFYKAFIFNKPFLGQQEGRFKNYPFRTYVGDTFIGGYSDHFPAYIFLIRDAK